jgi:hypothetical protein
MSTRLLNACLFFAIALLAVLVFSGSHATAGPVKTPGCGGFNQKPCTPLDTEFYLNSGSGFGCDRGLKIDLNNFFKTSDDQCVNDKRQTGPKDYSWEAWALAQQRYNIAAGEPINWVTTLNAHNAYNNKNDNYSIPDQKYSMTDLLNWGVRSLELDVHWVYGQVLVCHGMPDHSGCAPFDRLYAYAIRELGEWLDANPGEIIHINFEDRAENAPDDAINAPIKKWLGSKVWLAIGGTKYPFGYAPGNTKTALWPTMRQMAAAGKQVIITSSHTHGDKYIFPVSDLDQSDASGQADLGACTGNFKPWYQHSTDNGGDPWHWSRIYEGRAVGDIDTLLYEGDVTRATNCGIGIISLGWLNALGEAWPSYRRSGYDGRRDAMIWSWAQGEDASRGSLALLRGSDGRWLARPAKNAEKHQFACFLQRDEDSFNPHVYSDPTTFADPAGTKWYITQASDVWENGNNFCRAETNGQYVFGFPRNAKMQAYLMTVLPPSQPDVWLNYSINPIPLPSAMPTPLNFNAAAGSATLPEPRTMHLYSNAGDQYALFVNTKSDDGAWLQVSPTNGAFGLTGADVKVSLDPAAVARLKMGQYTASITVFDATIARSTNVIVSLHIKTPTQISITKVNPVTTLEGQATQITAKLAYVPVPELANGGIFVATGSVILRELISTTQQVSLPDPDTGVLGSPTPMVSTSTVDVASTFVNSTDDNQTAPNDTVIFNIPNLSPGTHSYGAYYAGAYDGDDGYTGDSSYAPSSSDPASVSVFRVTKSRMFATPPQSRLGDRVTISATISPQFSGGPPITGSLKFQFTASTGLVTDLGTYPVKNGIATFDYFKLPEGSGTISANYLGDNFYAANKSDALPHTTVHGNPILASVKIIPQGGTVLIDGTPFPSGAILIWQVNDQHQLSVPSTTTPAGGTRYRFNSWSDGLPATHFVGVPASAVEFVAIFAKENQLTLNNPANGAISVQPSSSSGFYSADTNVTVSAGANPGYVFSNFTGDLTGSTQPQTLSMSQPRTVAALVSAIPTQAPQLIASIASKAGDATARVWTIQFSNAGPGASLDTRLQSIGITQVFGTACTTPPAVKTQLPASLGAINSGGSVQVPVTIDFSGCPALNRFAVDVRSTANNTAYSGLTTINNQYR